MKAFFNKGQVVLFQGDSVTDCGRDREDITSLSYGYPGIIAKTYNLYFPNNEVTFINKGISGNRVKDVLSRYEEDIKELHPDFISILVGINDTWRKYDSNDSTTPEEFETTYRKLLNLIKTDLPACKIMILEPFVLNSLPDRAAWREDLDPKIQVVRKLAKEYADYFVPLDGILAKAEVEQYSCQQLAQDGVHPSELGHGIIAQEYIKTLM
jgi:lysophospholipase L1-like esterase